MARLRTTCRLGDILAEHAIYQRVLARRVGVYQANVSKWVAGKTTPPLPHALAVVQALQDLTGQGFEVGDIWGLE